MPRKKAFEAYLFSVVCVLVLSILGGGKAWSYNNPFVISESIFIFLLFKSFRINTKYVSRLSEASLACYISHIYLLRFCMIDKFVNKSLICVFLHQPFVACILYIIAFILYMLYKNSVGRLTKLVMNRIDFRCIESIINICD